MEDPEQALRTLHALRALGVGLAHNLGLRVVAEGVEDTTTLQALKAIGCDLAQGWFATPALDASTLLRWLSTSDWGLPSMADASGPVDHDDAAGNQQQRRDQFEADRFAEQDGTEEHAEQGGQEGERVQCARPVA